MVQTRNRLPNSVKTVINDLQHTINDVRNGVLLSPDLHQAFDADEIVIKCERNDDKFKYIAVALNIAYQVLEAFGYFEISDASQGILYNFKTMCSISDCVE